MIASTGAVPANTSRRYSFYTWLSVAYLAVAIVAFAPSYWIPLSAGSLQANPVLHLHAALFFSWMVLLVVQNRLVANGRIRRHRSVGMLGISLATWMVVAAVLGAVDLAHGLQIPAGVPRAAIERVAVGAVALDILAFAALFTAAIAVARDTESHRRLMFVATVQLLGAGLNRVFRFTEIDEVVRQEIGVALPILVADLLLVPLIVHDLRTRGRIHPANGYAIAALLLLHLFEVPLYGSALAALVGRSVLSLLGS